MTESDRRAAPPPAWARPRLVLWMLLAIALVSALAAWDSARESESVFRDVGREETLVASIVALDLRAHLAVLGNDGARVGDPSSLLGQAASIVNPGEFDLFVAPPDDRALHSAAGGILSSAPLRDGLDRAQTTLRLTRSQARDIGLVARTAMAGLAYVDAGKQGRWGVVAVATAARPRDRERRAFWRLVLGVSVATALVLAFGGIALRNQRRELQAEQALAIAGVERERDDQLGRAERVATMGTFAMGVVHEVATPLGVILGRAEQLRGRAGEDERTIYAVQAIIAQVDRIQIIIRRFLEMARGGPPSLVRTHPRDILRSAAAWVEHRFAKSSVSLTIDVVDDSSDILCDQPLLEQALVNLLLNACDACTAGGHVKISARADAEQVAFVVTDDGVGIDPKIAERAKEPFFTTKPAGAGTGLGLAIASEIAKSHRGTLSIAANGARGTRACVEIPAAVHGDAHVHAREASGLVSSAGRARLVELPPVQDDAGLAARRQPKRDIVPLVSNDDGRAHPRP